VDIKTDLLLALKRAHAAAVIQARSVEMMEKDLRISPRKESSNSRPL
jgi:hypothetical protein